MPTILRERGYRFFFFSRENHEPPHIHIESGDDYAKFWLQPVVLDQSFGYNSTEVHRLPRWLMNTAICSWRNGGSDLATTRLPVTAFAMSVRFDDDTMFVRLVDGREIAVPLEWFPTLRDATPRQRSTWRLIGRGIGIHWPELDEDVSVESLLVG